MTKSISGAFATGIVLIIAFAIAYFVSAATWAWILTAATLVAFFLIAGFLISGRVLGLVIDNRNRVSLSKFQAAAWTIVIISALVVAAFKRMGVTQDPLNIELSGELLALMGISATSFVAAPLILSVKASQASAGASVVANKPSPADASWLDMLCGDDTSNAGSIDLGKAQQLLITVAILIVYCGAIWHAFGRVFDHNWFSSFPKLSDQVLWLIGISHAGYLSYKAAPHGASPSAAQTNSSQTSSSSAPGLIGATPSVPGVPTKFG